MENNIDLHKMKFVQLQTLATESSDISIDIKIAELIESLILLRKKFKLTQKDLSSITGIPQPSISRIESLSVVPSLQMLFKILDVYGSTLKIKEFEEK